MTEDTMSRDLMEKIKYRSLKYTKVASEVSHYMHNMAYNQMTNCLVKNVSNFDENTSGKFKVRQLSTIKTTTGKGKVPNNGGI